MSIVRERALPWRALLASAVVVATLLVGAAPLAAAPGGKGSAGRSAKPVAGAGKQPAQEWTGSPGTNLAYDTFGYPWPAAPDCNESDVSSSGCVNDGRGYFQGQCTSWVAFRLSQRNGIAFHNYFDGVHWGNARDWARSAKRTGYVRNQVPAVGAIGWYARGHVSYVEEVNSDGSIVVSEMNTDGRNGFHVVTVAPGGASWPDKFIHVADVVPVDTTPPARPGGLAARHLDRGVSVSWRAPADDTGVAGYRVLRNGVPLTETTQPAYVDRQASGGQVYSYTVEAYDEAGNVSEPAGTVIGQTVPARRSGPFHRATEVATGSGTALCGRVGTARDPRIGCRVRTLQGWRTVRTGRSVGWGVQGTRAFIEGGNSRIWFCRELVGSRNACLPLDLTTLSWGFDRVADSRPAPARSVWVPTRSGPTRCGVAAERAACTTLTDRGWVRPRRTTGAHVGDPLSRAFVPTDRGAAFCRLVAGRATCTVLRDDTLRWGKGVASGRNVPRGRWSTRKAGPVLCPVGRGSCRVVTRS